MSSEKVCVTLAVNTDSRKLWDFQMTAVEVDLNIGALEVAKRELAAREAAKPIPPGTRVRYFDNGTGKMTYGTVASPRAAVYPNKTVGQLQEPQHVWAYWDGSHSFAGYVMRTRVEVVS